MVAPEGKLKKSETKIPRITDKTEVSPLIKSAVLKRRESWSEVTAGIMSRAETNIIPTTLMERRTVTAVRTTKR